MALLKLTDLSNGFSGEYWRITRLNINYLLKEAEATLSLYKDFFTRQSNDGAIINHNVFVWENEDFPLDISNSDPRVIIYQKIKETNAFFNNAQDI